MEYVIAGVLVLIGVAFTTYPLLSQMHAGDYSRMHETGGGGITERDAVYRELTDLEFEYYAGKVSEKDFRELTRAYRAKALALMELQDHRIECVSCGGKNYSGDSFCRLCGTALIDRSTNATHNQGGSRA